MSGDSIYERAYWDVQTILDEALGPNEEDGAGEGIASDVLLLAEQRDRYADALKLIGTECSVSRSLTCDAAGRTPDAEYEADRWCHQCIARAALTQTQERTEETG